MILFRKELIKVEKISSDVIVAHSLNKSVLKQKHEMVLEKYGNMNLRNFDFKILNSKFYYFVKYKIRDSIEVSDFAFIV